MLLRKVADLHADTDHKGSGTAVAAGLDAETAAAAALAARPDGEPAAAAGSGTGGAPAPGVSEHAAGATEDAAPPTPGGHSDMFAYTEEEGNQPDHQSQRKDAQLAAIMQAQEELGEFTPPCSCCCVGWREQEINAGCCQRLFFMVSALLSAPLRACFFAADHILIVACDSLAGCRLRS